MSRIPLAWKNLVHDPRRLLVAVGGIAFAVLLMFQQRGFNHALFDSTVALLRALDCDVIVFNRARFALSSELRFDRQLLDLAASDPDVQSVRPVYLENAVARLRRDGLPARPIRVIGLDPADPPLRDPELCDQLRRLALQPGTALIDYRSKRNFGFRLWPDPEHPESGELAGRPISITGNFSLGRDFAHEGNILLPAAELAASFPARAAGDPLSLVDLGVIRLAPGRSPAAIAERLQETLGPAVTVVPTERLIQREIGFWARSTPIGTIFAIGAIMGFVVGVVICYQVLATDIADHMGEFATLRAMGYRNGYFFRLVFTQSLLLSIMGFVPGLLASWLLFQFTSVQTGLLMLITWDRAAVILLLTICMCIVSGGFALRKLLAADPASLF